MFVERGIVGGESEAVGRGGEESGLSETGRGWLEGFVEERAVALRGSETADIYSRDG